MVREAIEKRRLKAIEWFPRVRVLELGPAEIAAADPAGLVFWNVNTPEEFARAERQAAGL